MSDNTASMVMIADLYRKTNGAPLGYVMTAHEHEVSGQWYVALTDARQPRHVARIVAVPEARLYSVTIDGKPLVIGGEPALYDAHAVLTAAIDAMGGNLQTTGLQPSRRCHVAR